MRVQVNLSDDMVRMVDDYAKLLGVSRSALCSMLIGREVIEFHKARNDKALKERTLSDDENGQ